MFCLDCGQKISDTDEACPQCGLKVSEMRERIAQAQEMVTYAETIGPASTQKLPPVPERIYKDKDGNVLRPEEKIDISERFKREDVLGGIPQIGSSDPYVTMPIKKVVSDKGEVVADVDREQKVFSQEPVNEAFWSPKRIVLVVLLVALLIAGCVFGYMHVSDQGRNSESTPSVTEESTQEQVSTEEQKPVDTSLEIYKALNSSYVDLDSFYSELRTCIDEFEGYFLLVDLNSRKSHAQGILDLQTRVTQSRESLAGSMKEYGVTETNEYYAQYQQIDELYSYLLDRIHVIVSCWDISLSYDDPRDYSQEILSPIVDDLQGGESISETKFLEQYPQSAPQQLE